MSSVTSVEMLGLEWKAFSEVVFFVGSGLGGSGGEVWKKESLRTIARSTPDDPSCLAVGG